MEADNFFNSLEYPSGLYEGTEEKPFSASSSFDDHEYFSNGVRFVKGCLWATVLSIPAWIIIGLMLFS